MTRETKAFILILSAIVIDRLCTAVSPDIYLDPFLFYDVSFTCGDTVYNGVNLQYVVKAVCVHLSVILFLMAVQCVAPSMRRALKFCIIVEILGIVDFFLIYEQAFFSWVEFTDIRILSHGIIIALWKTGKL